MGDAGPSPEVSLHRKKTVANEATASAGPAPLLATKLRPPRIGRQGVRRPRLDRLLSDAADELVTIVRAPSGFGKTTLALSWIAMLTARGDSVAWLSLDADDNEPRRFLNYAIQALRIACPTVGVESLRAGTHAPLAAVQSLLINEIADCGDDLFLFLDDYHCITHSAVHEIVSFLMRHAPENLHFIILSRVEPPFGLASLRAHGKLLEVDAPRLRFTREETQEFLSLATGRRLSPPDVRDLHGLTEGWPAALRILSLSLSAGSDPSQLLRSLSGPPRSIGTFFDDLCALYPREIVDFLTHTAVVDHLSAPLCAAITGRRDCAAVLEMLERQQLITPLDEDGTFFTHHQLFRDYLLQRLRAHDADAVHELHRRASHWYESRQLWPAAVTHLLAAGDTEAALVRIAECADAMVQTGDVLTLLGWEQQLRLNLIQRPLRLQLAITWAKALSLSAAEATQYTAAMEQAVENSSTAQAEEVRRECLALRALCCGLADDHTQGLNFALRYLACPAGRDFTRDTVRNVLRFAYLKTARWQEFYAVPRVPAAAPGDRAGLMTATYEAFVLGVGEMSQAKAAPAARHLLRCKDLGRNFRNFAGATVLAAGAHAELLYETGRTEEADACLREEIDLIAAGVTLDAVLRGLITASRLAWRQGSPEQAHDLLERAEAIGLTHDWSRLVAAAVFERLRLHLLSGSMTAALGLLKRIEQLPALADEIGTRAVADIAHYRTMARALVGIYQNRAREALADLEALFIAAIECGADLLAIRLGALLACGHVAARQSAPALRVFRRVLDLAEPGGFVAPIADAGPEIGALLSHVQGTVAAHAVTETRQAFVGRLRVSWAAAWSGSAAPSKTAATELTSVLTPRECEILELIAAGQSNKAIARQLALGQETVKTHMKHVFAKLEVGGRTEAVVRARQLGLVRAGRASW